MNSSVLPQSVVERLQTERARIENGAFSSSLGVPEMLIARALGYRVLGQVMGASVWKFSGQWAPMNWRADCRPTKGLRAELEALSLSIADARDLAVARLHEEARLLGAQGVVGARFHFGKTEIINLKPLKLQTARRAVIR